MKLLRSEEHRYCATAPFSCVTSIVCGYAVVQ